MIVKTSFAALVTRQETGAHLSSSWHTSCRLLVSPAGWLGESHTLNLGSSLATSPCTSPGSSSSSSDTEPGEGGSGGREMGEPRKEWQGGRKVVERAWLRWAGLVFLRMLMTASRSGFRELLESLPGRYIRDNRH